MQGSAHQNGITAVQLWICDMLFEKQSAVTYEDTLKTSSHKHVDMM